ncbi:MAG: hypothetical protein QG567_601 [Campylobacterota bacterium]|nr:hypothetical protein [Campylobacterota bacterium]
MRCAKHERYIVKIILEEGEKTATDFSHISNANQYFCNLEKEGILKSRWGVKGIARVKYRRIANIEKAMKFLGRSYTPLKKVLKFSEQAKKRS